MTESLKNVHRGTLSNPSNSWGIFFSGRVHPDSIQEIICLFIARTRFGNLPWVLLPIYQGDRWAMYQIWWGASSWAWDQGTFTMSNNKPCVHSKDRLSKFFWHDQGGHSEWSKWRSETIPLGLHQALVPGHNPVKIPLSSSNTLGIISIEATSFSYSGMCWNLFFQTECEYI